MNRKVALAAAVAALALAAAGCSSQASTTSAKGNNYTNAQQSIDTNQLAYVQPLPYFPFSQIKQNLIEIEAIQALGINSTSFIFVQGINHPVLVCPSQGVPVPATDELSNPVVPVWNSAWDNGYSVAGVTVNQIDPTGIFSGDTTGTNGLCLTNSGHPYDVYNEAFYITVTANAYWDNAKGQIVVTGTPVMPLCKVFRYTYKGKPAAYEKCTAPKSATTDPFSHKSVTLPTGSKVPVTPAPSPTH